MASHCPSARAGNLRGGEMSMHEQQSSIYKHSLKLERRTASLYVQNTGCQQCPPSYGWGPGVRNHFLLHHIIGGRGVFMYRNQRYDLQAGDTFLAYPDTTIHYYADAQDPWEYVWVGFGGLDAASYMGQTDLTEDEPVYRGRDSGELHALLEDIYQSYGTTTAENLAMTARLYQLLSFLVRTACHGGERRRENTDCALLAADYIINHYETPITVEGLAAYASVSHSSLYRRFMKRFQMSPKRFLLEYRIERACALLAATNHSIQEISNSVGFEDPFYFSRAFKEVKGLSPRQYANQVRGSREGEA